MPVMVASSTRALSVAFQRPGWKSAGDVLEVLGLQLSLGKAIAPVSVMTRGPS